MKISEKDISVTYLPEQVRSPYKVKGYKQFKYQVPAETDEKVRQAKLE